MQSGPEGDDDGDGDGDSGGDGERDSDGDGDGLRRGPRRTRRRRRRRRRRPSYLFVCSRQSGNVGTICRADPRATAPAEAAAELGSERLERAAQERGCTVREGVAEEHGIKMVEERRRMF